MTNLALLLPLLLVVVPSGLSACGHSCNAMGCGPALEVAFEPSLDEAASYRIEFVADGAFIACTASVPSNASSEGCEGVFGSFDRTETGAISSIAINSRPKSVTATLLKDGMAIAVDTLTPSYKGVEINGPGCGSCYHGRVMLDSGSP